MSHLRSLHRCHCVLLTVSHSPPFVWIPSFPEHWPPTTMNSITGRLQSQYQRSAMSEQDESPFPRNLHLDNVNLQAELSPSASCTRYRIRVHAQDLFPPSQDISSPPTSPSVVASSLGLMIPILPPEVTNIFDMLQRDLSPIPPLL